MLYRLVPALLGSLWLVVWGGLAVEGAVLSFWDDVTPGGFKPDRRHGHGLAYDTARGKVVLFGGGDGWTSANRPATLFQDTWEWDGAAGTWRPVNLFGNKPPARWGFGMAYDTVRGHTVLFGGWVSENPRIYLDDTWVWDGETWTRVNLFGPRPPARFGHAVAYDRARGKVVLFGGVDTTGAYRDDTWEWDGTEWQRVNLLGARPPQRYYHALAYDAARRQTVLFAGFDGSMLVQDTWVWDGTTWTEVNQTGTKPDARCNHAMAYDPTRERVVLFAGERPGALQDTWEWNGARWAEVTLTGSPPPARAAHAMAYDAAHDTLVLFGGLPAATADSLQDTWLYDDDNPVRQGYWTINECRGAGNTNSEPCYWHYRYDLGRCTPGQPCGKLLVFFSTGLQTCDEPATFTDTDGKGAILQAYAVNDAYVAVCANTFLTGIGPESVPYNAEAERVDQLMLNITDALSPQSAVIRSVWDGRHLLWSGVSHGATAPVIAMARNNFDERLYWKGSVSTGACFYDGVYNVIDLDLFWAEQGCTLPLHDLHARGIEQRYYGAEEFDHACDNNRCPCAPVHSSEIDEDTLTGGVSPATASDFAIANWKLIECGSALPACTQDRLPMKTIQDLCTLLGPGRCTFGSLAGESHNDCAKSSTGIPQCQDWFNALVAP